MRRRHHSPTRTPSDRAGLPIAEASAEVPKLLTPEPNAPPTTEKTPARHGAVCRRRSARVEHAQPNPSGYQEPAPNRDDVETDKRSSENCALLHRARTSEEDFCAPDKQKPARDKS